MYVITSGYCMGAGFHGITARGIDLSSKKCFDIKNEIPRTIFTSVHHPIYSMTLKLNLRQRCALMMYATIALDIRQDLLWLYAGGDSFPNFGTWTMDWISIAILLIKTYRYTISNVQNHIKLCYNSRSPELEQIWRESYMMVDRWLSNDDFIANDSTPM